MARSKMPARDVITLALIGAHVCISAGGIPTL
jgi:hypothetical protein